MAFVAYLPKYFYHARLIVEQWKKVEINPQKMVIMVGLKNL
jgi:hypothetical protein